MGKQVPSYEYRDGELVEVLDVVVTESGDLHEDVKRTLVIRPGVSLTVHGEVAGTVNVESGATLTARGNIGGTVNISTTASGTFHCSVGGTLNVERGAVATLAESAVALGSMNVDGALVNYGMRGVQVSGSGTVDDREGSTVREPDETGEDGTSVYYG